MGLRLKTATTISAIFLAVIGATYLLFSMFLLSEFKGLERARTVKNLERVSQAIDAVKTDLGNRALDWGHWDESLSFVEGENPQYVESNLNYEALVPFELKHVIFLGRDKRLVYGASVSSADEATSPLAPGILPSLLSNEKIAAFLDESTDSALTGLLQLDGRPTFVAVSTVTDSKMHRAPAGFAIFTRELSEQLQQRVAAQTLLPLTFRPRSSHDPFFSDAGSSSSAGVLESAALITGVGAIRDLSGKHIVTVEFSQPRDILQQGVATRNSLMAVMAAFLVVANIVVLLFVDRTVLKPLARFTRRISTISKTNDLTLKLPVDRRDEIGKLSSAFNGLIDSLRHSYQRIHEARNAAQDANDAKSKFIATVSHELRTPIHSITGMLRILRKHETEASKKGYIDMASDAAFGLLNTINEILDFSKAESGNLRLESREFTVRDVVERAASAVSPRRVGCSNTVELIVDVSASVPATAIGDGHRLGQVITNLLGNACKFTHDGYVALAVTAEDADANGRHTLVFTVEDTGIGIPESQKKNIFKAFHQGADSTARLYQGSGLGLSIVKQIVEAMGGSIAVESAEQRGTTFTASIPFETALATCAAPLLGSIALVAEGSAATERVRRGLLGHAQRVEVFDPSKPAQVCALRDTFSSFSRIVLWSTAERHLRLLEGPIRAAAATTRPVCAVLHTEDITLREELSRLGVREFHSTSCHLGRIAAGDVASTEEHQDTTPQATTQQSVAMRPLRVLIADDTPTNCIILQSMLEDAGHSVEVVTNGLELLNRLRPLAVGDDGASPVDLVLTDIQMPLMDGNTAIRKLRLLEESSGGKRRMPVVAVTAHALPEEQHSMRQSGMDEIVTKPVSPAELQRALSVLSGTGAEITKQTSPANCLERALKRIVRDVCRSSDAGDDSIDISGVFERSGNSLRRTRLILRAFLSAYGGPRDALAAASVSGDAQALSRAAHTLKGLLLDVGASHAAGIASNLEQQTKVGASSPSLEEEASKLITSARRIASLIQKIVELMPNAQ